VGPEDMHVAFLRDKLDVYADLVQALLERGGRGDAREALEVLERSRSRLLLDMVERSVEHQPSPVPEPLQRRIEQLRAAVSRAYHALHGLEEGSERRLGPAVGGGEDLRELEQAYRSALREAELIGLRLESGSLRSAPPSVKQIQRSLGVDEALLAYCTASGHIHAFVVWPSGFHMRPKLARESDAVSAGRALRYQIGRAGGCRDFAARHARDLEAGAQQALARLGALLLEPLEPWLAARRLVVVPHGVLHGLPFHAFALRGSHALDRWEIVCAPSAALWHARAVQEPDPPPGGRPLVMAVPAPGIQSVEEEARQVGRLLPNAIRLSGGSATLEAFRREAVQAPIVHLATHALFRHDNPLFSGLRFADGWLLARDLYGLRMPCRLASLSACSTGAARVEPGDELFGLLRGFLAAGARTVAASLWPADDESTTVLMTRFYTALAAGHGPAAAMRAAQIRVRDAHPHPRHWAPFVIVGAR